MATKRITLKNHIVKAWKNCVDQDYPTRAINSEHSLQAYFFLWLKTALESSKLGRTRLIFIEPCLRIPSKDPSDKKIYIPDLVVCDQKNEEIIAVIELKFSPRTKPVYKKDLDTLSKIATSARTSGEFEIVNERYRGPDQNAPPKYTLSKEVLFVWAGIHSHYESGEELKKFWEKEVKNSTEHENHFFDLHAYTKHGELPAHTQWSSPA